MRKFLLIAVVVVITLLSACSEDTSTEKEKEQDASDNLNESGMPIVNETITLNMMAGMSNHHVDNDWNDLFVWNEYEKMTNINVEWEQVPSNIEEKRNLALASDTLPDVFYVTNISNLDLFKYGQQGTILKLNDLIDQYAPNLKKLMNENPDIKKAITFPDGNIYSLPTVVSSDFLALRVQSAPWYNQNWLDALGMDVPETTDEFYKYLKAVQQENPSGGEVDEIPYGGTNINDLIGWLQGSFGVGNRGLANANIDLHPDEDKVRFYATTDGYKDLMEYLNKLYSEGLIAQNIFNIEVDQYLANASEGLYGSSVHFNPVKILGEEIGKNYVSGTTLEGPNGDRNFVKISPTTYSTGNFAITKQNENPAATVRWLDYFYSDEGAKLFYMGIEGETYVEGEDGSYEYVDKINNNPDGLTFEQAMAKYVPWIGMPMGVIKQEYFLGTASSPGATEAAKKQEPFLPEEIWPRFTYTPDESNVLLTLGTDIDKYVLEMRDKFIAGEVPISEWDNYVKTVEDMGLDEYMEIQQAAYERYKDN